MGGSSYVDDWEFTSSLSEARTLVLVGKTGNGKSATGNSILGKRAFKSKSSLAGVTNTCELQRTVLEDGHILNVIDTPGLFDLSAEPDIAKEIVNCIKMAEDGIHAVLMVLSIRSRFSREEKAVVESLQNIFGSKISDYMIVVFTGGDELEEDETLDDFLACDCPEALKEILKMCGNRRLLFDNKTKDKSVKSGQQKHLLSLVSEVVEKNGGKPFTDELFVKLKKGALKLHNKTAEVNTMEGYSKEEILEFQKQLNKSYEEQLKKVTEMVGSKLQEVIRRLEQSLAEEQAARRKAEAASEVARLKAEAAQLKAEAATEAAKKESNDAIQKLREKIEQMEKEQMEKENIYILLPSNLHRIFVGIQKYALSRAPFMLI